MAATAIGDVRFRPSGKNGNPLYGSMLTNTAVQLGTGGTTIVDSTTTTILLPKPASFQCELVALQYNAHVAAVSGGGTVLMQVSKRNNLGTPATAAITGTFSLESDAVTATDWAFNVPITATTQLAQTFNTNDVALVTVVSGSTLGTQPTGTLVATWALITQN